APFPGIHYETFSEVQKQAGRLQKEFRGALLPEVADILTGNSDYGKIRIPSLQFALDTAFLRLHAARQSCQLIDVISGAAAASYIHLNGLAVLPFTNETLQDLQAGNFRCVKVKVGRRPVEDELKLLQELSAELPSEVSLRLDANGAWKMEDAVKFAAGVKNLNIEYLEDPLQRPELLPEYYQKAGLPLALDESLQEWSPENFIYFEGMHTLVLKPDLLGPVINTLNWIEYANEYKLQAVVSSAFQSAVGFLALAQLAAACIPGEVAMGLETINWFKQNLLPLPEFGGTIPLQEVRQWENQISQIDNSPHLSRMV
ncbi:MAG: o-succinylbenzoate synthase, partial [Calditrichia bacterium]